MFRSDLELPGIDLPKSHYDDDWFHRTPKQRESGVMRGNHIQSALISKLKKFTPYVVAEGSLARFDVVAYVRHEALLGKPLSEKEELPCFQRFKRVYCHVKERAILDEIDVTWSKDDNSSESLWGIQTNHHQVWSEFKDSCKCSQDPSCPTYQSMVRPRGEKEVNIGAGLHIFEVKSERDTLDRLKYQIPQMMDLGDHVWLVLASNHELPEWLPPWIGVIRHNGRYFEVERQSDGVRNEPAYYWQALKYYGMSDAEAKRLSIIGHHMFRLYRDWFINSVFHWSDYNEVGNQIIVDMSNHVDWMKRLKVGLTKLELEGPDLESSKGIQMAVDAFFEMETEK